MTTFHSRHCFIYCLGFVQYWTLLCLASSSIPVQPCMKFLFVSASVCRRLSSDSTSRWTPLPLANSSYCQVCSGLSPPSCHLYRAHKKKKKPNNWFLLLNPMHTPFLPCSYLKLGGQHLDFCTCMYVFHFLI